MPDQGLVGRDEQIGFHPHCSCADQGLEERVDIDVVAADGETRRAIVGECKYRNAFDETEAIATLRHRAGLLKGCKPEQFLLLSKREPPSGSMRKLAAGVPLDV